MMSFISLAGMVLLNLLQTFTPPVGWGSKKNAPTGSPARMAPIVSDLPRELYFGELETIPRRVYTFVVTGDTDFTCSIVTTGTPGAANGDEFEVNQNPNTKEWELWTTSNNPYDDTVTLVYTVTVTCTDTGGLASTPRFLTLEVIDNEVVSADISATDVNALDTNTGDTVATVSSVSNLGHDVVYNMTTHEYFMVDPSTGVITAKKPLETIDTGTAAMMLTVTAYDTTDQIFVYNVKTLDFVNQNTIPSSSALPLTETRQEDVAYPTTLFTLTNDDPDAGQTFTNRFTCVPSSGEDLFELATNGVFRVKSGQNLDYEATTSFVCSFYISDGIEEGGPFMYTLTLTDVNEAPTFSKQMYHVSLNEGLAGAETQNPSLSCTDPDAGDTTTYALSLTNNGDRFNLDPSTGLISFSIDYDRDTLPSSVVLTVLCVDNGGSTGIVETGTSYITVTVNDVNDNEPVFTNANTAITIDENVNPGTAIGVLAVTDADDGTNGMFTCNSATSTSGYSQYFSIANDCRVYLVRDSTPIPTGTHVRYSVNATDQGSPTLTSQGWLDIFFSRTVTTTIYTTTEYDFFDHGENIAAFTFALIGGLILMGLITYCLMQFCCGGCTGCLKCFREISKPKPTKSRYPKRAITPESYRERRPPTPEYQRYKERPPTYDVYDDYPGRYLEPSYAEPRRFAPRPIRTIRIPQGYPSGSLPGYISYA